MSFQLTLLLTCLALLAFAGNSLLSRAAFTLTTIDAASFTLFRLMAGAITLWLLLRLSNGVSSLRGSWAGSICLFSYAILFSFAYLHLNTATGALLLFASVQLTMLLQSFRRRESIRLWQWLGVLLTLAGLLFLLLPGATAPSLSGTFLMLAAGIAWGSYSLLGQQAGPALAVTAGNFVRSIPLALFTLLFFVKSISWDLTGLLLAVISGAITSGLGYAVWYKVLPALSALQAASVQLAVPVLAALLAVILLNEAVSTRLLLAGILVLTGLSLVLLRPRRQS